MSSVRAALFCGHLFIYPKLLDLIAFRHRLLSSGIYVNISASILDSFAGNLDHRPRPSASTIGLNHLLQPSASTISINHRPQLSASTIYLNHQPQPSASTIILNDHSQPSILSTAYLKKSDFTGIDQFVLQFFHLSESIII